MHNFRESYLFSLKLISSLKNTISLNDWNKLFDYFAISLGADGIQYIDTEHLENILEIDNSFTKKRLSIPFIKAPRDNSKKYSLILDLDETLIHFPDHKMETFEQEFPNSLLIRPYIQQFIEQISKFYEIIVFTAASQPYADKILDHIDPHHKISHRLYEDHLYEYKNKKIKNLDLIGRDLKTVVIIEDNPENFQLQKKNGFQIKPWKGEGDDKIFCLLTSVFSAMAQIDPIPEDIRETLMEFKKMFSD